MVVILLKVTMITKFVINSALRRAKTPKCSHTAMFTTIEQWHRTSGA